MTSRGKPALFGWCIDDLHDQCMVWLVNSDRRCACTCHDTRENKVDSTIMEQYPEVVVPSWSPQPAAVEVATEVAGTASTSTDTTSTSSKVDARAIRAWAKSQGIEVGARGRIKPEVIARYAEAMQ